MVKRIRITMIAITLFLSGCENGDTEKTDTEEQTKNVEDEGEKLKLRVMKGSHSMNSLLK
ncbi:conserved hypothetical protein [Listeria monocytogenes FSL R2-503]|nr:conserved hypothetical protein [Listeria monocytogenes FSL R2-503]